LRSAVGVIDPPWPLPTPIAFCPLHAAANPPRCPLFCELRGHRHRGRLQRRPHSLAADQKGGNPCLILWWAIWSEPVRRESNVAVAHHFGVQRWNGQQMGGGHWASSHTTKHGRPDAAKHCGQDDDRLIGPGQFRETRSDRQAPGGRWKGQARSCRLGEGKRQLAGVRRSH